MKVSYKKILIAFAPLIIAEVTYVLRSLNDFGIFKIDTLLQINTLVQFEGLLLYLVLVLFESLFAPIYLPASFARRTCDFLYISCTETVDYSWPIVFGYWTFLGSAYFLYFRDRSHKQWIYISIILFVLFVSAKGCPTNQELGSFQVH